MKLPNLSEASVPQLVELFTLLCRGQFHAEWRGQLAKQNKFIRQSWTVEEELKKRAGDQRSALLPLLDHPNPQVRLMAAEATLALAPAAARQTLQDLSDRNIYPQAAFARQTMNALDRGERKPT